MSRFRNFTIFVLLTWFHSPAISRTRSHEQIQSPFSTISAKKLDNSMVIKDDFFSEPSVFPPGNHDDLPITNPENGHQHLQESEKTDLDSPPLESAGVRRWRRMCMGVMQTGIFRVVNMFRACKVGFCSLALTAGGVATMVMVYFMHRRVVLWWQRRMQIYSSKESLMALIREKDKVWIMSCVNLCQYNSFLAVISAENQPAFTPSSTNE